MKGFVVGAQQANCHLTDGQTGGIMCFVYANFNAWTEKVV